MGTKYAIASELLNGPLLPMAGNTYGASKGNPVPNSVAFFIIDYEGNLRVARGVKLADFNNIVAKTRAITEGLVLYYENGLTNIIIELDSLAMVNILEEKWEVPWCVTMEVITIKSLRRKIISTRVQHSLR
ncbi:hypothetical protein HAX54_024549 [Datura stramonium]|uniref:RNase H type-1 domain-containing protein n=1 Tax=Datura stramonium TaxID=4076 RepID=A0ABS8S5H9_DATST|nr:hypothetical protein [Datura stramonium]